MLYSGRLVLTGLWLKVCVAITDTSVIVLSVLNNIIVFYKADASFGGIKGLGFDYVDVGMLVSAIYGCINFRISIWRNRGAEFIF